MGIEIDLLGGFEVRIDGARVPASAWNRRQAAALVKVLALARRRQLHREHVIDALWPEAGDDAGPRLHKAAHFARRVLGPDAVILRNETVLLFPDRDVTVDAIRFEDVAVEALATGDAGNAAKAADTYGGPLLPDDPYESWAIADRDRLQLLYLRLLAQAERFAELVELDPTDADAQLALMRQLAAAGDRRAAMRQFERMDRTLRRELGVGPSNEATALRDSLLEEEPGRPAAAPAILVGRTNQTATLLRLLDDAAGGRGRTVFLSGAAGTGKSALIEWLRVQAAGRRFRTGHGAASAVEGAWPYAPVLEALADLSRRHPTLLDGLNDEVRAEIDRALAGRSLEWSGEGTHPRLFVAVAELVRLAAAGPGLLLAVDGMHEADEASLRLLHYLARSCADERLVIVIAHRRQPVTDAFEAVRTSLVGQGAAVDVSLVPLDRRDTAALAGMFDPGLSAPAVQRIWEVSGGLPFAIVELARSSGLADADQRRPGDAVLRMLSPATRSALEHIAITGSTFDTDDFLALSGLPEGEAFDCLDSALGALAIVRTRAGYQFRHPLIREALLDDLTPHRRRALHRSCAQRLVALDASAARIGHHLLAAGETRAAVPYVLRAAETDAAVGAYRDALRLIDAIRPVVTGDELAKCLALRADLLGAVGDPTAVVAYRQAITAAAPYGRRSLQAKLARIAAFSGDYETASTALEGLEPDGGPDDAAILLARGTFAYFSGDLDAALRAASDAGHRMDSGANRDRLDLVSLKGLITHNRGELNQLLRVELQRTRDDPAAATMVFDAHLCVAEYLLYGRTPYAEVIDLAQDLRGTADRIGALRGVAFADALIGEAALLNGNLDLAEGQLARAADLHRELGAAAGEAHSLQRLAEVHLYRGDRAAANAALRRALPLARWSHVPMHLVVRVYGTMVAAAEDAAAARAVVDAAEATLGTGDFCSFCTVMYAVPAAIACADAGDPVEARRHLERAEDAVALWEGTAWQAATVEVRAHIARAEGDPALAERLLAQAADMFEDSAQPLDAQRCRRG